MHREPRWLTRSIIAAVSTIAALSVGWSASCTAAGLFGMEFSSSETCKDADQRAMQTMFSLLATLVSLRSNPPDDGQP
jgi:hypothetical protein